MNTILTFDYASLYAAFLEPFRHEAFGPKVATALLALAVLVFVGFLCLAVPQAIRLRTALATIRGRAKNDRSQDKIKQFHRDFPNIDKRLLSNKAVSSAWSEFRKILSPNAAYKDGHVLISVSPEAFFNPRTLHLQFEFIRSLPNFFVGLGLLGTFIGLIAALTFSTQSLTSATDQAQIKDALNSLLTTAAAKFYISAAGLISSLALSLLIRIVIKRLHWRVRQINIALQERTTFITDQTLAELQLSAQKESLEELKLFNTNIAMKIGDAVRSAIETSNDGLASKLTDIADSFRNLVDASRDGAGRAVDAAVKGALDTSLGQASEVIGKIAAGLQDLPARLGVAATSIQEIDLSGISLQIAAASESLFKAASAVDLHLEKMLIGIGSFSTVAAETSRAARQSQEIVRDTVQALQQEMQVHIQRFDEVDEKLAGVFNSMGSQLELQGRQMAEQLARMDQALAGAVNQFEQLIDGLTEVMARPRAAE